MITQAAFSVLQKKLPQNYSDPGMFSIPCKIRNIDIAHAMCDLGASINVMPLSIYKSLNIGPLKKTGVVIQLADQSVVYPVGVLKDLLVQVSSLVFPVDFYVIKTENDDSQLLLLGRPFFKTSKIKIDVHDRNLTMEFDGDVIKFNINDAMKYPDIDNSISVVDVIDPYSVQVVPKKTEITV